MPRNISEDEIAPEESEQRLSKTLRAAFNMRPTPLKAIPKRSGGSRAVTKKAARASVATAKNALP